jgi:hypothetical protein
MTNVLGIGRKEYSLVFGNGIFTINFFSIETCAEARHSTRVRYLPKKNKIFALVIKLSMHFFFAQLSGKCVIPLCCYTITITAPE